jgi:hypothetical protein
VRIHGKPVLKDLYQADTHLKHRETINTTAQIRGKSTCSSKTFFSDKNTTNST